MIIADKYVRASLGIQKRAKFYYQGTNGCFTATTLGYVDIKSLSEFFHLWDKLAGFNITLPPDSPWYDDEFNQIAGMTIDNDDSMPLKDLDD